MTARIAIAESSQLTVSSDNDLENPPAPIWMRNRCSGIEHSKQSLRFTDTTPIGSAFHRIDDGRQVLRDRITTAADVVFESATVDDDDRNGNSSDVGESSQSFLRMRWISSAQTYFVQAMAFVLHRFCSNAKSTAVFVSLTAHASALMILAIMAIGSPNRPIEELVVAADFETVIGETIIDPDMEASLPNEGGHESAPIPVPDPSTSFSADAIEFAHADDLHGVIGSAGGDGSGRGFGEGAGNGFGTGLPLPGINVPSFAVTKGSFSVWTEPRDPEPGQPYRIIIQIRVPSGVTRFRGSDLTGAVIGTDTYRQAIRFKSTDQFPVVDGAVEIPIVVPGAKRLVRDTIRVESRLLREKQVIHIVF